MDHNKIDLFIGTMIDKFNNDDLNTIRSRLEKLDNNKINTLQTLDYKNPTIILIFSLFLGIFGIDRFMLNQPILGILKLISLGGFGIWAVIDWFIIMKASRKINFKKFLNAIEK